MTRPTSRGEGSRQNDQKFQKGGTIVPPEMNYGVFIIDMMFF